MCNLGENVKIESKIDETYNHDEADVTMISYVLDVYKNGAKAI